MTWCGIAGPESWLWCRSGVCDCLHSSVLEDCLLGFLDVSLLGFREFLVMYATRSLTRICQGMPRQHLHQPCVAGQVSTLSLSLSFCAGGTTTHSYSHVSIFLYNDARGKSVATEEYEWEYICSSQPG